MINGAFKMMINKPKFHLVKWFIIIEIPIIPPSITSFGSRNDSRANAAINAPIVIKNKLFNNLKTVLFFFIDGN